MESPPVHEGRVAMPPNGRSLFLSGARHHAQSGNIAVTSISTLAPTSTRPATCTAVMAMP